MAIVGMFFSNPGLCNILMKSSCIVNNILLIFFFTRELVSLIWNHLPLISWEVKKAAVCLPHCTQVEDVTSAGLALHSSGSPSNTVHPAPRIP